MSTALDGARIGVWRFETGSPETDAITEQAVDALVAAGATPVDVSLPYLDVIDENEFPALLAEFKRDINAYLAETPGRHPADLAGLIAFNEADPVELEFFGQEMFELAQAAPSTDDPVYLAQREAATSAARAAIDETLATLDLDAIMAPTNSPAWVTTLGQGDAFLFGSSGPAAVSRLPERHRTRRLRRPAAGRHVVLLHGVGRRRRPESRLRLRAGDGRPRPASAAGDDRSLTGSASAQLGEEVAEVGQQQVRRVLRSEVAAPVVAAELHDVGVVPVGQLADGLEVLGEHRDAGWNGGRLGRVIRRVGVLVVAANRRSDRPGEPVGRRIREDVIAIGPVSEQLGYPRHPAGGGVLERVAQGLGLGGLVRVVGEASASGELFQELEGGGVLRCEIGELDGSPDGNEKSCVTCTPTTRSGATRPSSGEISDPPSLPCAP